jgi:hypothetical membrane protein
MHPARRLRTFRNRYPFVGPGIWILCLQYYIVQIMVAAAWQVPYSWLMNTISDLGNTACGVYADRWVCSPLYPLMNSSFIVLGLFMALGSLLIFYEFKKSLGSLVGFTLMAVAGLGTLMVGLFPENTDSWLHFLGALLPFLLGNLALVILSYSLSIPRSLKLYTRFSGVISLAALVFFVSHQYMGLGIGGMERIVAYPQTIWLIVFGLYITHDHFMSRHSNRRR